MINLIAKQAIRNKGIYFYFFPTYTQGKKILWDGIDGNGFKFLDHFPKQIVLSKNDTEMKLTLVNGSIFQVIGTDNFDSIRGTNPRGCVFSEFAFQNPMAWEVVRPILAENGGWAIFNSTPNGKNHFYTLEQNAKDDPTWFVQVLTVLNTFREDGTTPVISQEVIEQERKNGMNEEMIQQEYFCSYDIGAVGAYYGDCMKQANEEGRITTLPFYQDRVVDTSFDLGLDDMMSLWFKQEVGQNWNFVNYYENNNKTLDYYIEYIREWIDSRHGKIGTIYVPHDSKKRDLKTGKSDYQYLMDRLGSNHVKLLEMGTRESGIQNVRLNFSKFWFDKVACLQGIRCLESYHREWDDMRKVFNNYPAHDWSSHGADSMRYMVMGYREPAMKFNYNEEAQKFIQGKEKTQIESAIDYQEVYQQSAQGFINNNF
jgi:hypothetical protein